ncbi:hypothetical protein [Pontibacter pamirensis]|uniref:hypothetical protein n=1 Tax=Pontibacter pamirensis TaxID=2562824 RepID=UPI0013894D98|nr:hypothetical protein [Pontibacter pamirensis]
MAFTFVSCEQSDISPDAKLSAQNVAEAHQKGVNKGSAIERTFMANLQPLNNSGVSGTATITVDANVLTVEVMASGLEPNLPHPQHIHGFKDDNRNATCPTPADDTNGDGFVDLVEGLPSYGPVLLELYVPIDEFPVADADGNLNYTRTFELGEIEFEEEGQVIDYKDLKPLQNRAIVLHGLTVNSVYVPTMPVACGQIMPTNSGKGMAKGKK